MLSQLEECEQDAENQYSNSEGLWKYGQEACQGHWDPIIFRPNRHTTQGRIPWSGKHDLTEEQKNICRDIRKQGKTKVATQNYQKRKAYLIEELQRKLHAQRERKCLVHEEHQNLFIEHANLTLEYEMSLREYGLSRSVVGPYVNDCCKHQNFYPN